MSLRSKIALALFLAGSLFLVVDLVLYRISFAGRFHSIDEADAQAQMQQALDELEGQYQVLDRSGRRLTTGLTSVAEDQDVELLEQLAREDLHLFVVYDLNGNVEASLVRDPLSGESTTLRHLPNQRLSANHPLLLERNSVEELHGLWSTELGALLISVQELAGDDERPMRLAVGRFLDEDLRSDLRARSDPELNMVLVQNRALDPRSQQVLDQVPESGCLVAELDDETLEVWALIHDLKDMPAMLLSIETPRRMAGLWSLLRAYASSTRIAVAVLFPFVILLLLQWIVTGPLSRLTSHATEIGRSNDTEKRLSMARGDEIGVLADEFDSMLDKLEKSREQVVHGARLAGMSEISAGVMHGVGNVFNRVTVSAGMACKRLGSPGLSDLRAILCELEAHGGELDDYLESDTRGKHLIRFFNTVVDDLEARVVTTHAELISLAEGIEHAEVLLSALQSSDSRVGVTEYLDLEQQLTAAVEITLRALDMDRSVIIKRSYDQLPRMQLDRHKLMEILVNLLSNALQSMEAAGVEPQRLTLGLTREGEDSVRLEVTDNGLGIAAEDLELVFTLGHTTKPNGRGLGLHLSSTAAGEMGGGILASSGGPGMGATFTLRLPMRVESRSSVEAA